MTLIPWRQGKSLLWDFTCTDTFAPSYISNTSSQVGFAAELAEKKKQTKYQHLQPSFIFYPVAIETSGVWGQHGLSLIKSIGQKIASITGEPRSTSYLIQRISISIQRGNAASILGTIPYAGSLEDIFYL